jgi:hypothetical protein
MRVEELEMIIDVLLLRSESFLEQTNVGLFVVEI